MNSGSYNRDLMVMIPEIVWSHGHDLTEIVILNSEIMDTRDLVAMILAFPWSSHFSVFRYES